IPTMATRIVLSMNLTMVMSWRRRAASCRSYRITWAFCMRNPKRIPVMAPVSISFMAIPSSVQNPGHDHSGQKKTDQGYVTADGYLSQTAQAVTARSPIGETRPEHQDHSSQKGRDPAANARCPESTLPHRRHGDRPLFLREPGRRQGAEEHPDDEQELPVDNHLLLEEIRHAGTLLRCDGLLDVARRADEGRRGAEVFSREEDGQDQQKAGQRAGGIGRPCLFSKNIHDFSTPWL